MVFTVNTCSEIKQRIFIVDLSLLFYYTVVINKESKYNKLRKGVKIMPRRLSWEKGLKLFKIDMEERLPDMIAKERNRPPRRVYIRGQKVIARVSRKQGG